MGVVTPSEKKRVLSNLRDMDPTDFEAFVARLWEARGWETEVTQTTQDEGIDFIARKEGESALVQVKRRSESNSIGEPKVREYASLYVSHPEADKVAIVTTGKFRRTAEIYALKNDIEIFDGEELAELAIKHRGELTDPDTGGKARVSAAVRRRPSAPALPSPTAGYNWLFSPAHEDRWRNIVSFFALLIAGGFLFIFISPLFMSVTQGENIGVAAMLIGWFGSIIPIYKDVNEARAADVKVRQGWSFVALIIPFAIPFVYLKVRDPVV